MKAIVFWGVMQCLLKSQAYAAILKIKAGGFSITLVPIYQTIWGPSQEREVSKY
jgi:hypothetical protein